MSIMFVVVGLFIGGIIGLTYFFTVIDSSGGLQIDEENLAKLAVRLERGGVVLAGAYVENRRSQILLGNVTVHVNLARIIFPCKCGSYRYRVLDNWIIWFNETHAGLESIPYIKVINGSVYFIYYTVNTTGYVKKLKVVNEKTVLVVWVDGISTDYQYVRFDEPKRLVIIRRLIVEG